MKKNETIAFFVVFFAVVAVIAVVVSNSCFTGDAGGSAENELDKAKKHNAEIKDAAIKLEADFGTHSKRIERSQNAIKQSENGIKASENRLRRLSEQASTTASDIERAIEIIGQCEKLISEAEKASKNDDYVNASDFCYSSP